MKITSYAAICAFAVASTPALAGTIPPTALFESMGVLSLNSSGFTASGNVVAEYNAPPMDSRPYIFSTSLSFGTVTVTPTITITTPAIQLSAGTPGIPAGRNCIPFIGCFNTPAIPGIPPVFLPSQSITVSPEIPLASLGTVYQGSFQSPSLPLGDVFSFDYGTPLFGTPLSFGEVVQDQFETGATTVNLAGAIGPFGGTLDYTGVLQPGGNQILGNYTFGLTGQGILGQIEAFALDLLNDNTDQLVGFAYDLFIGSNPCAGFGSLTDACNTQIAALNPNAFGLTVNSIGTLTADYTLAKSITPIPVPAALPLMAGGLGLLGLFGLRRRRSTKV